MTDFIKKVEVRWSDLDPNFHLRHSVYYDIGAYCRVSFFNENGITPAVMFSLNIGPIIFREECLFRKEIKFEDNITVTLELEKCNVDFSRWTMVHQLFKNENILAAFITVDGAWMDTNKRKLTSPPDLFKEGISHMPKTKNFNLPPDKN